MDKAHTGLTNDEIVNMYSPLVYRIASLRTKSKFLADDVFQNVFLRYISKERTFESEEHRKAWFIRATINCCKSEFLSAWFTRTEGISDDYVAPSDKYDEIRDSVMRLPAGYRDVILLFYYEDMPVSEIASALKLSEGNVKMRLSRARAMLKLEL